MNKKGIVPIILVIIIATVLLFIVVGAFFISSYFRWIIIGIGLFIAGVYVIGTVKNDKFKWIFSIILIGVALVFVFGSNILQTEYSSGLKIKSMSSNVNVISTDTDLQGVWWLINAYSGGGQSISGTLTPDETKSLTGYQTKYPLEIKVSALNEKINYQIQNTGTQIYTYTDTVMRSSCGCTSSCLTHPNAPVCPTGTTYTINFAGSANLFTTYICERHCYSKTQVGVLGTVSPSNVKGDVKVDLTVNNEKISQTIEVGRSADFVSSSKGLIAQVQYPSNGWTGNYPSDTSNFYAMYDIFGGKNQWTLTSKQRYTDYSSQKAVFENFLSSLNQNKYSGSLQEQYKSALADLSNKLANFNSQVIGLRNDDLSISQAQVWGNRNDQNNGKITIDTLGQLTNADLVFKVRADWLGIVINVGKPSIVSKTCQTFKAGDSSKITLQVKNIGSGDGNFVPSITCNNIKQTYNMNAVPISAGQTSSIQVPIDSGNFAPSSTTSDTCQIRVEEYNKPSNYATSSVTCSIEDPALCVEGSVDISGNCIRKCIEGKPVQLKCCDEGETLLRDNTKLDDEFSGYYCFTSKEENKTLENKQCSWYEQSYEKDVKDWKWYNYLTIGLIPPSTHAERGCRTADWLYLAIGAVVIVILGIYAINKAMPKKRRKR